MNQTRFLSPKEIRDGCIVLNKDTPKETRLCIINEEFKQAFDFIHKFKQSVTFFGGARLEKDSYYYQKAYSLAYKIGKELGYAIITGGGPGAMEAANKGASKSGTDSVGLSIILPNEQKTNPFVTEELKFYYFFSRKVTLSYSAEAYVYFPGGFGTLDEFFEILTLIQTNKIPKTPIILFGNNFWRPLDTFIKSVLKNDYKTISENDTDLYLITEDENEIIDIIKKSPIRTKD